jgi:site-specific DNA recombinase
VIVAVYTRVSQDGRGEARSVREQELECRAWVEREGWTLADGRVWSDNDVSASRYSKRGRPEWQDLMQRLEAGDIDLLMVWEPSRATRDRRVWSALAAVCEERGVRFACNGRVYDLSEPDDAFQLDLFFALAARESGTTRKRVLRSTRSSALAGRPHGKLLYGYTRTYREGRQGPELVAQVVVDEQADVVREAARRVASGEALYRIAQDFNGRGLAAPRGARWEGTQIKRLCLNPAYIGKRTHHGQVVADGQWPAILDTQTFNTCRLLLTDPRRRTNEGRSATHLLSGLARCGVCGGRVQVHKNRGYRAYMCVDGFHVSRKKEHVEQYVTDVIVARLGRPDALALLAEQPGEAAAVKEAEAEALTLRLQLEEFYEQAAAGLLSATGLSKVEAGLLPRIDAAERRAQPPTLAPVLKGVVGAHAASAWEELTFEQRRTVIALLCDVQILKGRQGARTFDPATIKITWL